MPNYKIEGDVKFYEELYKSLDEKEENNISDNICLITNNPLEENCVILSCNHKFNYDAIYNDVYNHKKKYNSMERNIIKNRQIRCPYCRTVQNHLLPERQGYKNVHGVNYFDETLEKPNTLYCVYSKGACNYKCADGTGEQSDCSNKYVKKLDIDGKTYCSCHYSIIFCKFLKEKKEKEKKEKEEKKALELLEKIKAKQEKQKAKEEEKMKKEEEKMKKVAEKIKNKVWKCSGRKVIKTDNSDNKNVVISSVSSSSSQIGCCQILKTGKNKGNQCGCKIFQQGLCSRHYKLLHPISPEETHA
jgi:hypothetical protein